MEEHTMHCLMQKIEIKLPNHEATLLRNSQKLSMFDDPVFLVLEQQSKNMSIDQTHSTTVQTLIQDSSDKTHAVVQATQTPPPPQPPQRNTSSTQTPQPPQTPQRPRPPQAPQNQKSTNQQREDKRATAEEI